MLSVFLMWGVGILSSRTVGPSACKQGGAGEVDGKGISGDPLTGVKTYTMR